MEEMHVMIILTLVCIMLAIAYATKCSCDPEYLSDMPDAITFSTQGWGILGFDCTANMTMPGSPMQICDATYTKGIGTHSPSEIVIELDKQYAAFQASVGLQWQDSDLGSVVFKVLVDDKEVFDSGIMRRNDPAKPVNVQLTGADELKLIVTDAGDGIARDLANWADATLALNPSAPKPASQDELDIAQFARVQTWNPARMDGARSSRTEEFKADELFLGTELIPSDGLYIIPKYEDGTGCIGLEWLERRRIRRLSLNLSEPTKADGVRVEHWAMANAGATKGGSTWQGRWEPLPGNLIVEGNRWIYETNWKGSINKCTEFLKIRWIIPASINVQQAALSALTDSCWLTTDLIFQADGATQGQHAEIEMYNGEILGKDGPVLTTTWPTDSSLKLKVRYCKPRRLKNDRTVIRVKLPNGQFGVAVDDLLTNDCVYVKEYGFFATCEPAPVTLDNYKKSIANRKTVLEEVREMPDQTFGQAMKSLHRPDADLGFTLLSLACDNHKFIVHRSGQIDFELSPEIINCHDRSPGPAYSSSFRPEFGSGKSTKITRTIAEGWMPIHTTNTEEDGIIYSQHTFVAPCDKTPMPADTPAWLNNKPLCLAQFNIENPQPKATQVSLKFALLSDAEKNIYADIEAAPNGGIIRINGKLIAVIDTSKIVSLTCTIKDSAFLINGELEAYSHADIDVYLPGWETTSEELLQLGKDDLLVVTESYWKRLMAPAMQIDIPDTLLANVIRASQVHCLLAARNEAGKWVAPWIGAMYYGPLESEAHSVIRGMMFIGQTDYAKSSLEYFIKRYNPEGFLTTGYTTMGTGWHLWTLGEFYALTRDKEWMKHNSAEIDRVCHWVMAQRAMTMKTDSRGNRFPEYGLMPPGLAADWEVYAYYAYLNGYYAAGLREAGNALADVGCADANVIKENSIELSREIIRAFHWTQSLAPVFKLRDGTWVPEYPTHVYCPAPVEDFYVGEDIGRSWCYDVEIGAHHLIPMGVMDPYSREADWMLDHMEDVQFLRAGFLYYAEEETQKDWFNRGGFAKVQPYYARNAEAYAMRDDVKPFIRSYFNALVSLLNCEDLSLWEHFFNAANNKTHETGYFLYQSRTMLVTERADELWLAPFVTSNWMRDGMNVGVKNAPTEFGPVSYQIKSHVSQGYIEAEIDPPTRQSPEQIVLRLRHPDEAKIKSVTVNGSPHTEFDPKRDCIFIKLGAQSIVVRAEY